MVYNEYIFLLQILLGALVLLGVLYMLQEHKPGEVAWRVFLLCGIWGGFVVAALLLVTDVSWPGWLMDTQVEEGRGCAPILGQTLPLNEARFSY